MPLVDFEGREKCIIAQWLGIYITVVGNQTELGLKLSYGIY